MGIPRLNTHLRWKHIVPLSLSGSSTELISLCTTVTSVTVGTWETVNNPVAHSSEILLMSASKELAGCISVILISDPDK